MNKYEFTNSQAHQARLKIEVDHQLNRSERSRGFIASIAPIIERERRADQQNKMNASQNGQ